MDNEIRNDVELEEVEFMDLDEETEPVEEKKSIFKTAIDNVKKIPGKGKEAAQWVMNNPEDAAELAVGALGTIGTVVLIGLGISNQKKAERTVYSKDIGETIELKRKLTNDDKVELDYRCTTGGQSKIEALNSMGLVKRK